MRGRLADFSRYLPPAGALLFPFGCRMMDEDAHSHSLAGGVTNTGGAARSLLRSLARPRPPVKSGGREGGNEDLCRLLLLSQSRSSLLRRARSHCGAAPLRKEGEKEGDGKLWEKGPFRGALVATCDGRIHFVLDGNMNYIPRGR